MQKEFDSEAQDTSTFIASSLKADRSGLRGPILVSAVLVIGVLAAMVFQLGSHRLSLLAGLTRASTQEGASALTPVSSAVYGFTTVEVMLASEGDLRVDGKVMGSGRRQGLQLAAGAHQLVARVGNHVLTEKFTAAANESLLVEFQQSRVRVYREVAATP